MIYDRSFTFPCRLITRFVNIRRGHYRIYFFFIQIPIHRRKVNSFASCDENSTARFHIPTKESILHNLFRCNFFSTLRRPFPPTPAQRGRHPPPPPSTLLVTNHAPFFSNPSFRILFVSVNVVKLLRSIVLPFHSFSNSFLEFSTRSSRIKVPANDGHCLVF